jgi:two-component system NarL family sensor kinase
MMMERTMAMETGREHFILFGLPREQLSGAAIAAQEREMAEVAQALHEDIAQRLACALAELEANAREAELEEGVRNSIASATAYIDEALKGMLDLSCSLRPAVIDRLGLAAALRNLTGRMNAAYHIDFKLVAVGREGEIPEKVKIGLYRIAQEALRNVAEYSNAREVLVCLNRSYSGIDLVISDDGNSLGDSCANGGERRFDPTNMRERAESMGGTFTCRSDHRGVTLRVHVPLARSGL